MFSPRKDALSDEEDDSWPDVTTNFRLKADEQEAKQALDRKYRHIYDEFVGKVIEEDERHSLKEIKDEIRPPYSKREIMGSIEYGVREGELEYSSSQGIKKT
jgi:hypothetical protein